MAINISNEETEGIVEKTSFKLDEYTSARPPPREDVDLFARITLYSRRVNCDDKAESSVNHVSVIAVIQHLESIID